MPMTPVELHDAALTLENEVNFYNAYNQHAPNGVARDRRELINRHLKDVGIRGHNAEDREHLRRYFDDRYEIPKVSTTVLAGIPDLEFWLDSVKYPTTVKAAPDRRPVNGAVFDTSFINNSAGAGITYSRAGLHWCDSEEVDLKAEFMKGRTLADLSELHQRAPKAIVDRLVNIGCLQRSQTDPVSYLYEYYVVSPRKRLPRLPTIAEHLAEHETIQQEVADHLTQAADHFQNLSNNLKEIIMNKTEIITIETKTLVNGVDISTLEDSTIYNLIATQEAEIEQLDKIKTKPKKLVAEIEKRKAGIDALVAYLDSKE